MIDIHSHILPQIDDGARFLEESMQMAKQAVSQGITHIVATPHHRTSKFFNHKTTVLHEVEQLNLALNNANIPLTVLPGQEIRLFGEMEEKLAEEELLTVNDTGTFILVELPSTHVPAYSKQLFYNLMLQDIYPIVVHPERNQEILTRPDILYDLVNMGVYTQLTAGSVTGQFGRKIKKFCMQLLENNQAHFIASDAHNIRERACHMQAAYSVVKQAWGEQLTHTLQQHALHAIQGTFIHKDQPQKIKQNFFQLLWRA
ncbi:tyrosine-protein phosphatase [Longirhabdus pacifica]|uniref:tyrosine-protein phosphatase n=1 Tax=Longirhabdus pacifica TaxID=2305227 RepID=UPI001008C7BA|nr:CpsB/CapC family capsule biosynthesis tyrosine phosphatase [Longirhabdus pacifica]